MRIVVIGGGITGQLIQRAVPSAIILDYRSASIPILTRAYGANYLWEPLEGIQCSAFPVITHIDHVPATPDSIRAYKKRINKEEEDQSTWAAQFKESTIGYEISEDIQANIRWGSHVQSIDIPLKKVILLNGDIEFYDILVSTIPLYALMRMLPSPFRLSLQWKPIYVTTRVIWTQGTWGRPGMYVNYITEGDIYRHTIRHGLEEHMESMKSLPHPASDPCRKLIPGKIWDHPETTAMRKYLEANNIHCFGRYATWNSNELVHQTWNNILQWKMKIS